MKKRFWLFALMVVAFMCALPAMMLHASAATHVEEVGPYIVESEYEYVKPYTYTKYYLTITGDGPITIKNKDPETVAEMYIVIEKDVGTTLRLAGVNICPGASYTSAIAIESDSTADV